MITVTAAILYNDDRVLIGRRKAGLRHAGKWEFPGGKLNRGETPQSCLKRELKEEFNIRVKVGDAFADNVFSYRRGPVHLTAFWVHWIDGEMRATDHDRIAWVLPANLKAYDLLPADIPFADKLVIHVENQKKAGP